MPEVALLGCLCSGHGCYPPRPNITASPNVYIEGIAVHRQSDMWASHCCDSNCHGGTTVSGSSKVYINGLQVARIGDPVSCGSVIAEGSSKVICGG